MNLEKPFYNNDLIDPRSPRKTDRIPVPFYRFECKS